MKYTVSGCAKELADIRERYRQRPTLYRLLQLFFPPLSVACTLGAMAAFGGLVVGPYQIIRREAATEYYWSIAVIYMAVIAFLCCLFGVKFWRQLTWNRTIDADAVAVLAGFALGLWVISGTG